MKEFLKKLKVNLPGFIAKGFLILLTTLWVYWGTGEAYYEGWWGAWTNRILYLIPGTVFLILLGIVLKWQKIGSWVLIIIGGGIFIFWLKMTNFNPNRLLVGSMLGGFSVIIGMLLLLDIKLQEKFKKKTKGKDYRKYIVGFAPPLLAIIYASIVFLPLVLDRYDDNDRSARLIEGNGVSLIWAPVGPGWDEGVGPSQEAGELLPGAILSWNKIALYGVEPIGLEDKPEYEYASELDMQTTGLCRYLSADGLTLMDEPQDIWRMPTTQEVVRSLVRRGENAGCSWDGKSGSADCDIQPNKDSPLWAPDNSPIYYWTADEYDSESAWYVPYTGGGAYGGRIDYQPKNWGNSRHGFRCVGEEENLEYFANGR